MYKKGDKVRVKSYKRLRTIFVTAEHTPGKEWSRRGYVGVIDGVFEDTGETTYTVKRWDKKRRDWSWEEHSEGEIAGRVS